MNIALGSATLIRMEKRVCGALASEFIASHHARANNSAELVARKICPKMRGSRRFAEIRHRCRYAMNTTTTTAATVTMMLIAVAQSIDGQDSSTSCG